MKKIITLTFYPFRYTQDLDGFIIERYDIAQHGWDEIEKRSDPEETVLEHVMELNDSAGKVSESYIVDDLTPFMQ